MLAAKGKMYALAVFAVKDFIAGEYNASGGMLGGHLLGHDTYQIKERRSGLRRPCGHFKFVRRGASYVLDLVIGGIIVLIIAQTISLAPNYKAYHVALF